METVKYDKIFSSITEMCLVNYKYIFYNGFDDIERHSDSAKGEDYVV